MITFAGSKDPGRVLRNAVLDDVTPPRKGQVFEYWRGETDTLPVGKRGETFRIAWMLHELGKVELVQKRHGDGEYSYRAVVK